MLLAVEFPPESAEWTFFIAALVLLVGPIVVERLGLPGIVGIVLGGTIVGPFVLDWITREGLVEALGQLGLLYLMFLAGLELDLDEFQRNRRPALSFGALTFSIPFVLGIFARPSLWLRARGGSAVRGAMGIAHARGVSDRPGASPHRATEPSEWRRVAP